MVFLRVLCGIAIINFPVFTSTMYKSLSSKKNTFHRVQKNSSFKLLATRSIHAQEKQVGTNECIRNIIGEGFQLASLAQETKRMNDQSHRLINAMNAVNMGIFEKDGIVQLVDSISVASHEDQKNMCSKLKDANTHMKHIYDAEWNCLVAMMELLRRIREQSDDWHINAQKALLTEQQIKLDRLKKNLIQN